MSATIHAIDAYSMFQRGMDTFDIANLLQRDEASVLREISQRRSRLKGLPYPYTPHAQPAAIPVPKGIGQRAYYRDRNDAIMKRIRAGASISSIADEHGITSTRVWQIVRSREASA